MENKRVAVECFCGACDGVGVKVMMRSGLVVVGYGGERRWRVVMKEPAAKVCLREVEDELVDFDQSYDKMCGVDKVLFLKGR